RSDSVLSRHTGPGERIRHRRTLHTAGDLLAAMGAGAVSSAALRQSVQLPDMDVSGRALFRAHRTSDGLVRRRGLGAPRFCVWVRRISSAETAIRQRPVSEPIISVERVSMAYRLYAKPADMLREALFGGVRHDTFWALRDVSLTVGEKQRVGIIGPNGAGK